MMKNNCHSLQIIESLAVKLKYLFKRGDKTTAKKKEEEGSLLRYAQYVKCHLSAAVLFLCTEVLFAKKKNAQTNTK